MVSALHSWKWEKFFGWELTWGSWKIRIQSLYGRLHNLVMDGTLRSRKFYYIHVSFHIYHFLLLTFAATTILYITTHCFLDLFSLNGRSLSLSQSATASLSPLMLIPVQREGNCGCVSSLSLCPSAKKRKWVLMTPVWLKGLIRWLIHAEVRLLQRKSLLWFAIEFYVYSPMSLSPHTSLVECFRLIP